MNKTAMRVLVVLLSIPITHLLEKIVTGIWAAARPHNPSTDVENSKTKVADAVAYAALTAAAGVAAQMIARKGAEKSFEKLMGEPAPAVPTAAEEKAQKALEEATRKLAE